MSGSSWTVVSRVDVARHAGNKAPTDVRQVAQELGFRPVDLSPFTRASRADRALSIARAGVQSVTATPRLARTAVLLTQHPLGRVNDVLLARWARRTRSIVLVHDLESLRRAEYAAREQHVLKSYDVVVVHTEAMAAHLQRSLPRTTTVVLGCFDYLVPEPPALAPLTDRPSALHVVGRLGPDKAAYLYALDALALPVRAYGHGCVVERLPAGVSWQGVLDMDRPSLPARDGFGVMWDGTSAKGLQGSMGTYLRYNSPHKFSMYMALGLPVIVPNGAALSALVEREGLGLVCGSIAEAAVAAAALPADRWRAMGAAVERLRERLLSGGQTRDALSRALELVGAPHPR